MTERLLDISNRLAALQAQQGMIDEEAFRDTLEGLEGELADKILRCLHVRDEYLEEVARMKEVAKAYKERIQRVQDTADYLSHYIVGEMQNAGVRKLEEPEATIWLQDYPTVDILNEAEIPSQLMRHYPPVTSTPDPQPDKDAILEQMAAGEVVPGCAYNANTKVQVRRPKTKEKSSGKSE